MGSASFWKHLKEVMPDTADRCRVLPSGEFNVIIADPLFLCSESLITRCKSNVAKITNIITNIQ